MAKDTYFLYVKFDGIDGVIRLYDDYNWRFDVVKGDENILNGVDDLNNYYDLDDVIDYLREEYDYVEEIEYGSIEEYIQDEKV